jgi:hypothetical protein
MMRRSIFTLVLTVIFGVSFALSGDGDKKATKSTTGKKAGGCCMQGAKAEKAVNEEAKATDGKAAVEVKHAPGHTGHKSAHGDLAEAKDCDPENTECCDTESAEVKAEKKVEKKPLR